MGSKLAVAGDLGFFFAGSKSSTYGEWSIFPAYKFDNLINQFKLHGDEGLDWYLAQTPWLMGEYDYLQIPRYTSGRYRSSFNNDFYHPSFRDAQSLKSHYKTMEDKFKLVEAKLLDEVIDGINTSKNILHQTWLRDKKIDLDLFQELQDMLFIAAANDVNFSHTIIPVNDGYDFNFEFHSGRNTRTGRFIDSFWKATGNMKKNSLLFSFRLSDITEISTVNGRRFEIKTNVGNYCFP